MFGDRDNNLRGQGQRRLTPQTRVAGHHHGQSSPLLNLGENLVHRLAHFKRIPDDAKRTRHKAEACYCKNVFLTHNQFLTHNHSSNSMCPMDAGDFFPWKRAQHVIEVLDTFILTNLCTAQPPHPSTKKSNVCDRIDQGIQIVVARLGLDVNPNKLGRHRSDFRE